MISMRRARHVTARICILVNAVFLSLGLAYGLGWTILAALAGITAGIVAEVAP